MQNRTIPSIASEAGTEKRSDVISAHLSSFFHKECVRMEKIRLVDSQHEAQKVLKPLHTFISKANEKQATEIRKLMIQVYLDAKRLNLSARSWPAIRYVAAYTSSSFSFNDRQESIIPTSMSLSYVNPPSHLDLLTSIVEADTHHVKEKIRNCLAISLRVDGSVDRAQKDKIYIMAKIVTSKGDPELLFMGVKEQVKPKAVGLLETVILCLEEKFGVSFTNEYILKKLSSICTDGTNLNSGERGGFWVLLEKKLQELSSEIPFVKVWCRLSLW